MRWLFVLMLLLAALVAYCRPEHPEPLHPHPNIDVGHCWTDDCED